MNEEGPANLTPANATDDPMSAPMEPSRRRTGRALMIVGLAGFLPCLLVLGMQAGGKWKAVAIAGLFLFWLLWKVGKTMLRPRQ